MLNLSKMWVVVFLVHTIPEHWSLPVFSSFLTKLLLPQCFNVKWNYELLKISSFADMSGRNLSLPMEWISYVNHRHHKCSNLREGRSNMKILSYGKLISSSKTNISWSKLQKWDFSKENMISFDSAAGFQNSV